MSCASNRKHYNYSLFFGKARNVLEHIAALPPQSIHNQGRHYGQTLSFSAIIHKNGPDHGCTVFLTSR